MGQDRLLSYFSLKFSLISLTPYLALKIMKAVSGLKHARYGLLQSLSFDKR